MDLSSRNQKSRSVLSKDLINLEEEYLKSIKDVRRSRNGGYAEGTKKTKKREMEDYINYGEDQHHHIDRVSGKRRRMFESYLALESLLMLVCLTVSLLVLPVVLPPLPPPPSLLLLLPILILALLMLLAFMPSASLRTHSYT